MHPSFLMTVQEAQQEVKVLDEEIAEERQRLKACKDAGNHQEADGAEELLYFRRDERLRYLHRIESLPGE